MYDNPWFVAVLLMLAGPIGIFWGRKFIPWVISVTGFFVVATLSLLLFSVMGMLDYIDPTQTGGNIGLVILSFTLALVFGGIAGFLLWKFLIIGVVILGGVAGFIGGYLLYNLILITFL